MISVIIPLYNKELSIGSTLQSVLDQTFQEFEIVIVNDGSTDKSVEVVESINDKRIRLVQQENQGVSAARNKGIEKANYEWIAFLDGDDLWKTNHLEEINKMRKLYPNEKVFVTSFKYSDNRKKFRHLRDKNISKIDNYFKEAIDEALIWTSVVVIHKSCFKKVGLFNSILVRGEDKDLWARLGRNYNIIKSQLITATYRIEAENRSDIRTPIKQTFEAIVDLYKAESKEEYAYYKHHIIAKLKATIVRKEWYDLTYLLLKHNVKLLIPKFNFLKD